MLLSARALGSPTEHGGGVGGPLALNLVFVHQWCLDMPMGGRRRPSSLGPYSIYKE